MRRPWGLESVCRVGRCAINDNDNESKSSTLRSDNDNKYYVERTRSYQFHFVMFSFACTHSSTRFLIRRARRALISRVYSFAYTRNFVLGGNYIPTTNMMTARSVAQVSLAFSRLRTSPSWISFASLIYLLQMLLPSCTHKSLMASTSILISCFLTVLTFHSHPRFRHSHRHILSHVLISILLSEYHQACFVFP